MKRKNSLNIVILIFLLISVFYPLTQMLLKVEWSNFNKLVSSSAFQEALVNSIIVTAIAKITIVTRMIIVIYNLRISSLPLEIYLSTKNISGIKRKQANKEPKAHFIS